MAGHKVTFLTKSLSLGTGAMLVARARGKARRKDPLNLPRTAVAPLTKTAVARLLPRAAGRSLLLASEASLLQVKLTNLLALGS